MTDYLQKRTRRDSVSPSQLRMYDIIQIQGASSVVSEKKVAWYRRTERVGIEPVLVLVAATSGRVPTPGNKCDFTHAIARLSK